MFRNSVAIIFCATIALATSRAVESAGVDGQATRLPAPEADITPTVPTNRATAASSPTEGPTINGTLALPNFWWGVPSKLAKSPWQNEIKVVKDDVYFKVLLEKLPFTIVIKYAETSGPLWLSSRKGGRELGRVAPKGKADSVYAYTFTPTLRDRVLYISDSQWRKSNAFLPIKFI